MFLRAQHFQQQDRALDGLVRGTTRALRPHSWGLVELVQDRDLLSTGRLAVLSAAGMFEDGTPFAIPGETDHPPPLELPDGVRNVVVYLGVPIRQAGAVEVSQGEIEGRFALRSFEAYDTHSGSPQPAELAVGRLRLRYLLESEDRTGYHVIGLARIVEVASNRRVVLDDRWIPPALVCSAVPQLSSLLAELSGLLNQRGEALAPRLTTPGSHGMAEIADFLLLQTVNRWQKLLNHWTDSGNIHPEDFYAALVQMAGELATFTETNRRPNPYPAYRHEDLQRSFTPVVADLRRYLTYVGDPRAVAIPLQDRGYSVRVGVITDRSILRGSKFVLTVQADMPAETLRRLFPSQVKVGAVEHIRELVNSAVRGIDTLPMPAAPREIPFYEGASYFELSRTSPHWALMQNSSGFGLHVSREGDFPNLRMELWAIRGQQGAGP